MITLEQDFREVRRLLDDPKPQRPSPDFIVSELIASIQHLQNRQNNTGKPWNRRSTTVTTVVDQAEYPLLSTGDPDHSFGKAMFVYRALSNNVILPVPFTDFTAELNNQRYEFWLMPLQAGDSSTIPGVSGVKVGFIRDQQGVKMRIFPVPTEAGVVFSIYYATGSLDWSTFDWSDVPSMPEYSRLRQLTAAIACVGRCEWEGYDMRSNRDRRSELREDLKLQYAVHDDEFSTFIRTPQHDPIEEIGPWWA